MGRRWTVGGLCALSVLALGGLALARRSVARPVPPRPSLVRAADEPFREIYDAGFTRYVDSPRVRATRAESAPFLPSVTVHHFEAPGRGPLCMRGDPFFVETREGESDDLLVFLQGGGVCLNDVCLATSQAALSLKLITLGNLVGIGGVLDASNDENPLRDFDVVHVPYCDGSIFSGDVDRVLSDGVAANGREDMAYQRGLLNATAAFDTAKRRFPAPRRVVVAGTSGGAYGAFVGAALARLYYPDREILVIADSGALVAREHDPTFLARALDEIGASAFIPKSCDGCLALGHVSRLLQWAMARDPKLRVGFMSHLDDRVIGHFFMAYEANRFGPVVLRESEALVHAFPERASRFLLGGERHTFLVDVGRVPALAQSLFLAHIAPSFLTGDNLDLDELGRFTFGSLDEEGTDPQGRAVTGYAWLRTILDGSTHLYDVVAAR